MSKVDNFKIVVNIDGVRLDKYLAEILQISRTKIKQLFELGLIFINDQKVLKISQKVNINDCLFIKKQEIEEKEIKLIKPYEFKLDTHYEDDQLIIVYKPSGMLSHPTNFNEQDTLINALKFNYPKMDKFFLVHRLDKDTSGLIIIAKNEEVQNKIQTMFTLNKIEKKYYAIVLNWFNDQHIMIDKPICRSYQNKLYFQTDIGKDCKEAKTEVLLVKNLEHNLAFIDIILHTGRTHQIRVHLKSINHPILNDPLYGTSINQYKNYNQFLMSYYLKFNHPITNKLIEIKIDLDEQFKLELIKYGFYE